MNCQDAQELFVGSLYGELNTERAAALNSHLEKCPACAARLAELTRVREMVTIRPDPEPSPLTVQRVLAHAQAVASPSPSRAEFSSTGMLQYFDLKPLVDGCMDELPANKPGLFGFAVTTLELSVIKNLGERVKEQLKRGRVRGPTSQKLSENIPISNVVNKIIQQHSAYLEQDHLWSICIVEKQKANDFWRELCQSVADQKLKHRIIVIMGVTPDSALPNDIVRLEWSCFKKADVRDWLLKMSDNEDLQWLKGDELLSATNYILDQRIQDMSDAELVYTCLQEILDSLRENPDDFRQQIEKGV